MAGRQRHPRPGRNEDGHGHRECGKQAPGTCPERGRHPRPAAPAPRFQQHRQQAEREIDCQEHPAHPDAEGEAHGQAEQHAATQARPRPLGQHPDPGGERGQHADRERHVLGIEEHVAPPAREGGEQGQRQQAGTRAAQAAGEAPGQDQPDHPDQAAEQVPGGVGIERCERLEQRRHDVEGAAIVAQVGELERAPVGEAGGVPVHQHAAVGAQPGLVPGDAVVLEGEHDQQARHHKQAEGEGVESRPVVRRHAGGFTRCGWAPGGRSCCRAWTRRVRARARPCPRRPAVSRLKPLPIMLTGSTQKKSWPGGT